MAGSLAEPALTDFLDSFLAQPLDFRTQHNSSPLLFKPNGTTQGFQGQGSLLNTVGPAFLDEQQVLSLIDCDHSTLVSADKGKKIGTNCGASVQVL